MKAFLNDPKVKDKYLDRVKNHRLADEIVKGKYWENGKGCAVGCTIHSGKHSEYETQLGIPVWIAKVEDMIFEGIPNTRAKLWPEEFLHAINIGSDLNKIKIPFLIFVVESAREKFDHKKHPKQLAAIDGVLKELKRKVISKNKLLEAKPTDAAAAASAAAAYAAAAKSNEYIKFADNLLKLIRECK